MHPARGIVRIYRRSHGLSMRPDDQSTLTRQSANTNDSPRDPLHCPVTFVALYSLGTKTDDEKQRRLQAVRPARANSC